MERASFTKYFSLLMVGACLLTTGCRIPTGSSVAGTDVRQITVLYTNDEHGYMEGMTPGQGAANMIRLWEENEGFSADGPFLVLSGGDNWTGPAISTWVQGESMIEVMNAMGYDASAVGNHEFDFELDGLARNTSLASFPYLSANTFWRADGRVPVELGILPYTLRDINGLRVGIIGLTTTSTPFTANPRFVAELSFGDYESALRETVPLVRAHDPDLLFVIAHVCLTELQPLALRVQALDIDLMGGGHCNELMATEVGDTILLGGGYHYTAYAKARLSYDRGAGRLIQTSFGVNANDKGDPDAGLTGIVERWKARFEGRLSEVIAWSSSAIDHTSDDFRQAVVDSWLWADPSADVAITNVGGLRTPLPAGAITLNDLINTMPFENNIIAVNVTGAVLLQAVAEGGRPIVAGMRREGDLWIVDGTGLAIDPDQEYRVLVNSFMYDGGDNFHPLAGYDPEGFDTGTNYRQPLVDWLRSLQSSPASPLSLTDLP